MLLVFGGLGIDEIHGDSLDAEFLDVGEAGYGAGGGIRGARIARFGSIDAFVESGEDLGGLIRGHIDEAAPYSSGGEAAGRETRDDAEIIGAAFEGAPEVGIS